MKILKTHKNDMLNFMMMLQKYSVRLMITLVFFAQHFMSSGQEISSDYRYGHAKLLYQKEAYLAARNEFEKVEDRFYETEVKYFIASCAVKSGQNDGEFLIKEFVRNYSGHRFAKKAFFELGNYYFDKSDFEYALKYFKEGEIEKSDEVSFKIGYSNFQLEKYDESLKCFAELKGASNDFEYDAGYFQGFIYYEREDFSNAYDYLKLAFNSNNYKEEAIQIYVSALFQLKEYKELIDLVDSEMPDSQNPIIINYTADAHYALKAYKKAKENYGRLLKKKSKYRNEFNFFKAGYSSYKIGNMDDATDYLKRAAVADDTVGAYASYYLGLVYHAQTNLPFAVTSFENTAKYETKLKEDAMFHQGSTLIEFADYKESIIAFSKYKEVFPNGKYTSDVNELLSLAYSHTNDYDLAMAYIEELPSLTDPVKRIYQRVTFIKAMELFNDKKFKEASEIFQKSLVYNADSEITQKSYYWMGESLSILRNEKDAVFYYRSVRDVDQVLYKKSIYGLGYSYFNLKKYDDALVTFSKLEGVSAELINQRYIIDALLRMADCHFALKSYDEGIKYYNKALTAGSKNKDRIYFQIGLLNRYLERDEEAKSYFSRLITEIPESKKKDQAQFQIAEIEFKTENQTAAIASYAKVLENYPNSHYVPFSLLNQAVVYDNLQKNAESIKNYKEILDRFPRHETAKSALLALQGKNANGTFDEFEVFLDKYKSANPNSEALENIEFENARILFFNQKYDESIAGFESFIKAYPKSALLVEARYFIGDAFYRKDDFKKSLMAFYLISEEADFLKNDRVLKRIAEMESDLGRFDKGNEYYYELGRVSNSSRNQIFVERGLMENYLKLGNYDSTIYYGNKLLDNAKIGVLVEATANLSLGKAYYFKKEHEDAHVYFLSLVSNSPDEKGAEANFYIAQMYFAQGAYDKSLESLFSLSKNFKNYDLWVGKAFLLMSDVYLKTDEVFQAKATLNSLIAHSELEEVKKEAKAKLKVIEAMDGGSETGNN